MNDQDRALMADAAVPAANALDRQQGMFGFGTIRADRFPSNSYQNWAYWRKRFAWVSDANRWEDEQARMVLPTSSCSGSGRFVHQFQSLSSATAWAKLPNSSRRRRSCSSTSYSPSINCSQFVSSLAWAPTFAFATSPRDLRRRDNSCSPSLSLYIRFLNSALAPAWVWNGITRWSISFSIPSKVDSGNPSTCSLNWAGMLINSSSAQPVKQVGSTILACWHRQPRRSASSSPPNSVAVGGKAVRSDRSEPEHPLLPAKSICCWHCRFGQQCAVLVVHFLSNSSRLTQKICN